MLKLENQDTRIDKSIYFTDISIQICDVSC